MVYDSLMVNYNICVVTTEVPSKERTAITIAKEAILGGATIIQLREKDIGSREFLNKAKILLNLTRKAKVPLIINDRLDIAMAAGADGVHLGQEDMPIAEARELIGKNKIIGISATVLEEAIEAEEQGADYLGVGPIFPTPSKEDATEPMGIKGLKEVRKHVKIPIVAIGGITGENVYKVIQAGANGIAVISAIALAPDIKEATMELASKVERYIIEGNSDMRRGNLKE